MLSRLCVQAGRPSLICRQYARASGFSSAKVQTQTTTRKTLKERLLAPTSGVPFAIGNAAIAGGAALGVGALCFYGLGLSSQAGALEESVLWPQYVRDRIHTTYAYLGGGLVATVGAAAAAVRSPLIMRMATANSMMALFGTMAAIIGTGALARSIPYSPGFGAKQAAWLLHVGTMGAVLAPMVFLGGPVLIRAALYTAGIVGGLSAIAVCAPSDKFLKWSAPLSMGLGVVFISSIGTWFLPPTSALGAGIYAIAMYGGLLLFSAFLLYDTQRVIKHAQVIPYYGNAQFSAFQEHYGGMEVYSARGFDPINEQMGIYMNILNIFIRMAMIMSGNSRRK